MSKTKWECLGCDKSNRCVVILDIKSYGPPKYCPSCRYYETTWRKTEEPEYKIPNGYLAAKQHSGSDAR